MFVDNHSARPGLTNESRQNEKAGMKPVGKWECGLWWVSTGGRGATGVDEEGVANPL